MVNLFRMMAIMNTPTQQQQRTADNLPQLLSIRELAEYLGCPTSTIYQRRSRGEGPPGFRLGKAVRFKVDNVDRWIREQALRGARPKTAA
jgi:excisionase family DNA binding protein